MKPVLALISADAKHLERVQSLGQNLDATILTFANDDEASENEAQLAQALVILVSGVDVTDDSSLAGRVQVVKYGAPDSWIIVIAEGRLKTESAAFLKKSGAQFVLLEDEFLQTSKAEFVCSQRLHGEWVPIKSNEIRRGTPCPVAVFHFMPLNRKFLPLLTAGIEVDESKYQKLQKINEVYIRRDQLKAYTDYVTSGEDRSAAGLVSRCRRQYMAMNLAYKELVMMMTDQSEGASFQKGKELWDQVHRIADDFMTSLASVGDAWQIVNNAGFDDFTPVDRAPAIGASAGLMSLLSGIGNATDVFLGALLSDIGLLDLPPKTLIKWKQGRLSELSDDERRAYENHPISSLNRVLARRIPITDNIRDIVMNTHERLDMKGFPHRPLPEKIPETAMIVHLAELMDSSLKLEYGKERQDTSASHKAVLASEKASGKCFPYGFLNQIEKALA